MPRIAYVGTHKAYQITSLLVCLGSTIHELSCGRCCELAKKRDARQSINKGLFEIFRSSEASWFSLTTIKSETER